MEESLRVGIAMTGEQISEMINIDVNTVYVIESVKLSTPDNLQIHSHIVSLLKTMKALKYNHANRWRNPKC